MKSTTARKGSPEVLLPPPPYRLRRAARGDGPAVFDMVSDILAEYGLFPDPEGTDADLNDIEASYFSHGGEFFILLTEHDEMAGTVGIYPLGDGICELRKMYLDKLHRGTGLGKYLMEFSLSEARQLGFETMTLETASVLKEALGLYTRYGFQPIEENNCHLPARCDLKFTLQL